MHIDWHDATIEHLCERYRVGKLPHALLFNGAAGIGKTAAAQKIAQAILCLNSSSGQPCGHCQACELLLSDTHPNLTFITPETNKEKQTTLPIKIDAIRNLSTRLVFTSQLSGPNIAIIKDADLMNQFAANALLKTLEEPTANTLIILISHQLTRLLPTIRSRCQQYNLKAPDDAKSFEWLQKHTALLAEKNIQAADMRFLLSISNNAPLHALQLIEQDFITKRKGLFATLKSFVEKKITVAEMGRVASEFEFQHVIALLQSLFLDNRKMQADLPMECLINRDAKSLIRLLSETYSVTTIEALFDQAVELKRLHNPSINMQLMLESFFAAWHN